MFRSGKYYKYYIIFGFWTLIALLIGIQVFISDIQKGMHCGMLKTIFTVFPNYFLWSFYTLLLLWLTKRYPIDTNNIISRIILLHLPVSLIIAFIHVVFLSVYYWLINISSPQPFNDYFENFILYKYIYQIGLYAGVLIGCLSFNIYDRYNQEKAQVGQLERMLAESKLDALKMQLQPHFLFNTLNTISMLVRKKDEQMATNVIATLGDLLRYVLENREIHWVELYKEISFVEKYLSIEKIRFNERLNYTISIESSAENILIPDLILQPIIENAIKHGLSPKTEGGAIVISAKRTGEYIEIVVTDNGLGFDDNKRKRLSNGIGLKNIEDRLANIYRGEALLKMISFPNVGTTVEFKLPIKSEFVYE